MGQPYVGQLALVGFTFAPVGWMTCQGQILPISENEVLFQLIGTTFGGDGEQTFALPDLQGRTPMHMGGGFVLGQIGGVESVTLTTQQIPNHSHALIATTSAATGNLAASNFLATSPTQVYSVTNPNPTEAASANALTPAGGSQPHENLQPYLCCNWIISLFGVFPSQT